MQQVTKKNFLKRALVTAMVVIIIDLVLGSIFIPHEMKDMLEVRNLNPIYNHGFNKKSIGVVTHGLLHPLYLTNSLGMKDAACRDIPLTSKKKRILFIGDSFTEGVGYEYSSTFCGHLSAMAGRDKIDILNAGVASYSPAIYYLKTDYLLNQEHLKVDELYCFLDYSDVFDELIYQNFKSSQAGTLVNAEYASKKFLRTHSVLYWLYSYLAIQFYLHYNDLPDDMTFTYWIKSDNQFNEETNHRFAKYREGWLMVKDKNDVIEKALGLAKRNLSKLNSLCLENNIKMTLVIYPYPDFVKPANSLNEKYISIWQSFAENNQIGFVNLFPLFVAADERDCKRNINRYYIPNDPHWNAEGHRLVADSLLHIIGDKE